MQTAIDILKRYWGYDGFRGIQSEIIASICDNKDTLGLMPTGGGKSITFQIPALMKGGVCIVITPLIALMRDQVVGLKQRGIRAAAIYSGMSHEEIVVTLDNAIYGGIQILYVSPERLSSELFLIKLAHIDVTLFTVDEAHCISQWGYDFRPSYLEIAKVREIHPNVPILALTATATPNVVKDIQQKLGFKQENVFRMSFERKNLAYVVRQAEDKMGELEHILNNVPGSAIVYVRTRKRTVDIAEELTRRGMKAIYFHAGLDSKDKEIRQRVWKNGESRVIVATNAFGMGIDKPDVRLVIHYDSPDSIEAYFQEAGRAGRDGEKAYAVLLYNNHDIVTLHKHIADTYPEKDYVRKVYEHIAYYYQLAEGCGENNIYQFDIDKFCQKFKHYPIPVLSSLKILQQAGYLDYEVDYNNKARFMFTVSREHLYRLDTESEMCNNIINYMLRNYSGLFSEYCYIEEAAIASALSLQEHQVYLILKYLDKASLASFIPARNVPYVIYRKDRVEASRIKITPEVYEKRKEEYAHRIRKMSDYITDGTECRSRQLLRYFGERNEHKCGICDVCLN